MPKYAGADWLPSDIQPSELGVKVADVLGQVYQGIYHVFEDGSSSKNVKSVDWGNKDLICVKVYGPMSTYDDPRLTILALCCAAANVYVTVSSRWKNYLWLEFRRTGLLSPVLMSQLNSGSNAGIGVICENPYIMADFCILPFAGKIESIKIGHQKRGMIVGTTGSLTTSNLIFLVRTAHLSCCRVELSGRANKRIQMIITGRNPEGKQMYDRHPSADEFVDLWKPYWEPLLKKEECAI